MKILFLSDIHDNLSALKEVDLDFDALLLAGDLTINGKQAEALKILEPLKLIADKIYTVSGNMDYPEIEKFMSEISLSVHSKGVFINEELAVFGCGGSSPTPFNTANEFSDEEIYQILEKGYNEVAGAKTKIMLCHTPALDTHCDKLPNKIHVGSKKVREFIEKYQPNYCICGHIHEGIGVDKIGKTIIMNAGSFAEAHYGYLNTDTAEIELI